MNTEEGCRKLSPYARITQTATSTAVWTIKSCRSPDPGLSLGNTPYGRQGLRPARTAQLVQSRTYRLTIASRSDRLTGLTRASARGSGR
jgi:hypothetical protein